MALKEPFSAEKPSRKKKALTENESDLHSINFINEKTTRAIVIDFKAKNLKGDEIWFPEEDVKELVSIINFQIKRKHIAEDLLQKERIQRKEAIKDLKKQILE